MEKEQKQKDAMVRVPEEALLSLVASVLKDKVLFPEKIEDVRRYLQRLQPVGR
ncbi:MAG: hypothetical protein ABW007_05870 [Chitinophagaceae bacterium]